MTNKNKNFTIDVAPEIGIYRILQNLNYGVETALSEFIDNSIQSYIDNKSKIEQINPNARLVINIHINKDEIIIEDNAGGIKKEDFARTLRFGIGQGFHNLDSLSQYGIGMKISALWFTDNWMVETSAINAKEKFNFEFNLKSLLGENKTTAEVMSTSATANEHYTKITLKNHIKHVSESQYIDYIIPFIKETFLKFKGFVDINFFYEKNKLVENPKNTLLDTPQEQIYPAVDKGSKIISDNLIKWKVNIEFEYKDKKISGFIIIREKGSYKNHPGIRLLRNNRVIQGISVKQNIPEILLGTSNKYAAQRIYGEFNLNEFHVDFMKTGFNEDLSEFYSGIKKIIEEQYQYNLLSQATNYRANSADNNILNQIGKENIVELQLKLNPSHEVEKPKEPKPKNDAINDKEKTNGKGNENPHTKEKKNDKTTIDDKSKAANTDNKITCSVELENAFDKLQGRKKILNLYKSLCFLYLSSNSVLAYIGAWAFLEIFTSNLGRNSENAFPAFLGSKISEYTQST